MYDALKSQFGGVNRTVVPIKFIVKLLQKSCSATRFPRGSEQSGPSAQSAITRITCYLIYWIISCITRFMQTVMMMVRSLQEK